MPGVSHVDKWTEKMNEILIDIQIEPLEEGGYLATSEELHELIAQGRTVAETMEIAQDVARKLIESQIEHGDPLPSRIINSSEQTHHRTTTIIPNHPGTLPRGTLRAIIRQSGLNIDEFLDAQIEYL